MSKERKTITVDPEVAAYLDKEGRNASQTVNRLVKLDMGEDAFNEEILRMRMDQTKERYKQKAAEAREALEQYNRLQQRLEDIQREREEEQNQLWQDALEHFDLAEYNSIDHPVIDASEPEIEEWADKLDMEIDAFRDRLLTELGGE